MGIMEIKKYLEKVEKYFRGFDKARWKEIQRDRYKELKAEIDSDVASGTEFNDAAINAMLKRVVDADAVAWIVKDLFKKLEEK